ncbi:hypothetical protein JQ628_09525 [Bradyrhizobium lablabi]|uniref:hypothetical protein n=1 Tax=Bradyrhizobium lablabi TaxID=722472 RepID=UPI001BA5FE46|nr:hypothetical protein [Bradyrhizobium lablabi]MBR1121748.1 hypothetical protein [Bradyrhizobium lablabi]
MLKQKDRGDDYSKKSHPALVSLLATAYPDICTTLIPAIPRYHRLAFPFSWCRMVRAELKLFQLRGELVFSLIKDLGVRVAAKQEAVPFLIAFAIAEFFFKFKSFTLECLAFLAVWCVLSFLQSLVFPHKVRSNT